MTSAAGGVAASQQQNWFGKTMSNIGGGFSTAWKNMFSSDYIAKNREFYKWMEDSGTFSTDASTGLIQRLASYFLYDKADSLDALDGKISKEDLQQIAQEGYNLKAIQSAANNMVAAGWAPSNKDKKKVTADIDFAAYGAPEGSYRQGLDEVPYDDYPALLHEGEAVLTASTANELRNLVDEYRSTSEQSANFDAIINNQTSALVNKLDEVINVIKNPTSALFSNSNNDPYASVTSSMIRLSSTKSIFN